MIDLIIVVVKGCTQSSITCQNSRGLDTLCVLNNTEYTCSHKTVQGMYPPRSTNSYVAFWNPRNLLISKDRQKHISEMWSNWLTLW
jgi:hypothetical protein